jgi:NitT/TauT family transport system substrate-binding protein
MDACVTGEPATTVINKQLAGCRMLFDTRSPEGAQALFGSDYPAATLYGQKEWIDSHPKEAQALTDAIIDTLNFIETHTPKEVVDKMPPEIQGTNKELYLELFTNMSHIFAKGGRFTEGGVKTCIEVLGSGIPEVAAANLKPENLYTNKFVDASKLTKKS